MVQRHATIVSYNSFLHFWLRFCKPRQLQRPRLIKIWLRYDLEHVWYCIILVLKLVEQKLTSVSTLCGRASASTSQLQPRSPTHGRVPPLISKLPALSSVCSDMWNTEFMEHQNLEWWWFSSWESEWHQLRTYGSFQLLSVPIHLHANLTKQEWISELEHGRSQVAFNIFQYMHPPVGHFRPLPLQP